MVAKADERYADVKITESGYSAYVMEWHDAVWDCIDEFSCIDEDVLIAWMNDNYAGINIAERF